MPTEVVKGAAKAVRYTIDVRGDRDGVSTRHHTLFKIGDMTVTFTSGSPPVIGDGDQISVAGQRRGRTLVALAYVNRTALIRGDSGMWQSLIGAVVALPFGAAAAAWGLLGTAILFMPELEPVTRIMVLGGGLFFFCTGLYLLYRWAVIRRAVKMLKRG
jgi:hypothetical protein